MTGLEQAEKRAATELPVGIARSNYQKLGKDQTKRPVRDEPIEPDAASVDATDTGGEIDLTRDLDDGADSSGDSNEDEESGASKGEESEASGDESQRRSRPFRYGTMDGSDPLDEERLSLVNDIHDLPLTASTRLRCLLVLSITATPMHTQAAPSPVSLSAASFPLRLARESRRGWIRHDRCEGQ